MIASTRGERSAAASLKKIKEKSRCLVYKNFSKIISSFSTKNPFIATLIDLQNEAFQTVNGNNGNNGKSVQVLIQGDCKYYFSLYINETYNPNLTALILISIDCAAYFSKLSSFSPKGKHGKTRHPKILEGLFFTLNGHELCFLNKSVFCPFFITSEHKVKSKIDADFSSISSRFCLPRVPVPNCSFHRQWYQNRCYVTIVENYGNHFKEYNILSQLIRMIRTYCFEIIISNILQDSKHTIPLNLVWLVRRCFQLHDPYSLFFLFNLSTIHYFERHHSYAGHYLKNPITEFSTIKMYSLRSIVFTMLTVLVTKIIKIDSVVLHVVYFQPSHYRKKIFKNDQSIISKVTTKVEANCLRSDTSDSMNDLGMRHFFFLACLVTSLDRWVGIKEVNGVHDDVGDNSKQGKIQNITPAMPMVVLIVMCRRVSEIEDRRLRHIFINRRSSQNI